MASPTLAQTLSSETGPRSATALVRSALALAAFTYVLVVLGALVRAHGAGLACPDWPLCFGRVVPEFDLRVAFEWGHRALAGSIALGFAALCAAVGRRTDLRGPLAPILVTAGALLVVQILLGALTVWELLASWTVTSHLVTGNAFAAVLLIAGVRLRELSHGDPGPRDAIRSGATVAVAVAALLLVFQMILGGLVASRFVGLACPDWPTCLDGEWFPTLSGAVGLQVMHRINGYALWAALGWAALASRGQAGLSTLAWTAWVLATFQIAVGVANVLLRIPVEVTGLHSALAAALVAVTSLALREVWRRRGSAGATTAPA